MKILVYVTFEELHLLEAGEKVEARAAMGDTSYHWVQVMVDTEEYALERNDAFFGAPFTLQKSAR